MYISRNKFKTGSQTQTEASPTKLNQISIDKNLKYLNSQFSTQQDTAINSKKLSHTQQQIYSHKMIQEIMNKRNKKTVKHKINNFDPDSILYAKPRDDYQNQEIIQFSEQKKMYQSDYTKKIIDINKKLNHKDSLSSRIKNRKKQQDLSLNGQKKRPRSAQIKQKQDVHKKISVSGLVSYNFNSINARKNLGFDFEKDNDKLDTILNKLQIKSKCCINKQHSVLAKRQKQKAMRNSDIKNAIFVDFDTNTNNFLDNLDQEIQSDEIVYGLSLRKIICIRQLMKQQKIEYNEAEQIVKQIQNKKIQEKKEKISKIEIDQDFELNNRKKIYQKNKVMLKHLYFAQS